MIYQVAISAVNARNLRKRWINEYLSTLQHRAKWIKEDPNIKRDDLVIKKKSRPLPFSMEIS